MYIVTGGAGFIGSNVVAGLEKNFDDDIVIIDNALNEFKWKNLRKRSRIKDIFIYYEEAFKFMEEHKSEIKAVIHMGESLNKNDISLLIEENFRVGIKIWNFCAKNAIPLIYGTSFRTYGHYTEEFKDDFSEDALAALHPDTPYAWSKNLFDIYVARNVLKYKKYPPQWVGLKFFSVYGPNEYHKETKKSLIVKAYPYALKEKAFSLYKSRNERYADGEQMRDFVYIKDCVDVIVWMLNNPNVSGLFNIGTGTARTFKDMAVAVYKAIGVEPKIRYDDIPENLSEEYRYFTQADISKLRNAGYTKAFTPLEDGVKDFVLNYLHTSDPYI